MDRYKVVRVSDPDFDDYYTWDIEDLKVTDDEGYPEVIATVYDSKTAKEFSNYLNKKRSK
jgi:hypothetical protein